jgi:hypothetical protein
VGAPSGECKLSKAVSELGDRDCENASLLSPPQLTQEAYAVFHVYFNVHGAGGVCVLVSVVSTFSMGCCCVSESVAAVGKNEPGHFQHRLHNSTLAVNCYM